MIAIVFVFVVSHVEVVARRASARFGVVPSIDAAAAPLAVRCVLVVQLHEIFFAVALDFVDRARRSIVSDLRQRWRCLATSSCDGCQAPVSHLLVAPLACALRDRSSGRGPLVRVHRRVEVVRLKRMIRLLRQRADSSLAVRRHDFDVTSLGGADGALEGTPVGELVDPSSFCCPHDHCMSVVDGLCEDAFDELRCHRHDAVVAERGGHAHLVDRDDRLQRRARLHFHCVSELAIPALLLALHDLALARALDVDVHLALVGELELDRRRALRGAGVDDVARDPLLRQYVRSDRAIGVVVVGLRQRDHDQCGGCRLAAARGRG